MGALRERDDPECRLKTILSTLYDEQEEMNNASDDKQRDGRDKR